jgi:CBS-domain-containing membrane protein
MLTANKELMNLTAADLMSDDLVAIPRAMSLRAAAHLLSQAHISGAPVMDQNEHCVGVISMTDIAAQAGEGDRYTRHAVEESCAHSAWQVIDPETVSMEEVGEYMTPDPVTVAPATPIGELARMMTDAHIHRVIVVSPKGKPIGVVSSTDILAALAQAHRRRIGSERVH